jgi:hypothetical protein
MPSDSFHKDSMRALRQMVKAHMPIITMQINMSWVSYAFEP